MSRSVIAIFVCLFLLALSTACTGRSTPKRSKAETEHIIKKDMTIMVCRAQLTWRLDTKYPGHFKPITRGSVTRRGGGVYVYEGLASFEDAKYKSHDQSVYCKTRCDTEDRCEVLEFTAN